MLQKFGTDFYERDVLEVAPALLGQLLVRVYPDGSIEEFLITETEAYRGEEDLACHACKGRTTRTEIMYQNGGYIYVYLIYGMYWMLNIVTGNAGIPQAVLIRGVKGFNGPGKVSRRLFIDKSFYGQSIITSNNLFVVKGKEKTNYTTAPRVGIDYAGNYWKNLPWRFILKE